MNDLCTWKRTCPIIFGQEPLVEHQDHVNLQAQPMRQNLWGEKMRLKKNKKRKRTTDTTYASTSAHSAIRIHRNCDVRQMAGTVALHTAHILVEIPFGVHALNWWGKFCDDDKFCVWKTHLPANGLCVRIDILMRDSSQLICG